VTYRPNQLCHSPGTDHGHYQRPTNRFWAYERPVSYSLLATGSDLQWWNVCLKPATAPRQNATTWNANEAPSVGWKNAIAMSPYNDTWKIHRKNITKVASTNVSVSVFDRVQEAESAHFLLNVLDSPNDLFDHIRKWVLTTHELCHQVSNLTNACIERPAAWFWRLHMATQLKPTAETPSLSWRARPCRHSLKLQCLASGLWISCLSVSAHKQAHTTRLTEISEISPRWVSRYRIQGHRSSHGQYFEAMCRPAVRIRQATNAREET